MAERRHKAASASFANLRINRRAPVSKGVRHHKQLSSGNHARVSRSLRPTPVSSRSNLVG